MEKRKFIYQIETEPHHHILIRVLARFARNRIVIEELQSTQLVQTGQRISVMVSDTHENASKLSRKIETEIDVLSVKLFEQTS